VVDFGTYIDPKASPLSVGDVLAIINVVVAGCKGISDRSDDAQWLSDLQLDLLNMRDVIEQLQIVTNDSSALDHEPRDRLANMVQHCYHALSDLTNFVTKFDSQSGPLRYWRRLKFSLVGRQELEPHQRRLHGCLTSLPGTSAGN
jgi:hypothetical protein